MTDLPQPDPAPLTDDGIFVQLTYSHLNILEITNSVKSPEAGAIVTFAGTTRNNFQSRTVVHLSYSSYAPLALRTMMDIAKSIKAKYNLIAIAIVHRLGEVPVGEESILIAISSPHRQAAWRAGEETLEEVKDKVEVWKYERFEDGGEWRANRDGLPGVEISKETNQTTVERVDIT